MNTTRHTLLRRVQRTDDANSWERFFQLYAPILLRYASSLGLAHSDAEETRDRCLEVLARRMPEFRYDTSRGSFRSFLFRIVRDQVVDLRRRRQVELLDSESSEALVDDRPGPDELWERTWLHEHLLYCLETIRVNALDAQAFRLLLFDEVPVREVAQELGMTENQVYKAKSKVLRRLRGRLRELGVTL